MKLVVNYNPPHLEVSYNAPKCTFSTGTPIVKEYIDVHPYEGEYEVTPSENMVVLATDGKRMLADVVINPIPSNYGMITWDGSVLTVS